MESYTSLITEFLQQPFIAVVGISSSKQTIANDICQKLRNGRRTVYAVGRNSTSFQNDSCYPDLASLPSPVQGVFVVARPVNVDRIVEECITLKIPRVWIHNMAGINTASASGISEQTRQQCRDHGITLIPGACPMMFVNNADFGHRCIKWFLSVTGRLK
ncbi:MAG: CoA-binding protein [Bacteriovoracaceae bacterium]|nr:CoA-binding protein [Bacteroidota bacterium]